MAAVMLAQAGFGRNFSKVLTPGANPHGADSGVLIMWIGAAVCVAVLLAFVLDGLLAGRRRAALCVDPALVGRPLTMSCRHCKTTLIVPLAAATHEVTCPNCNKSNPPLRRVSFVRRFLRWALYPSFQDLF